MGKQHVLASLNLRHASLIYVIDGLVVIIATSTIPALPNLGTGPAMQFAIQGDTSKTGLRLPVAPSIKCLVVRGCLIWLSHGLVFTVAAILPEHVAVSGAPVVVDFCASVVDVFEYVVESVAIVVAVTAALAILRRRSCTDQSGKTEGSLQDMHHRKSFEAKSSPHVNHSTMPNSDPRCRAMSCNMSKSDIFK